MADRIRVSIAAKRGIIEGAGWSDEIANLISRYATANLYKRPEVVTERLRKDIVKLISKRWFAEAHDIGESAARPVLEGLGRELKRPAGDVAKQFRQYSKANLKAFHAGLRLEVGSLTGEIEAAFARAYRDGTAKKELISDLVAADREELKRLAEIRGQKASARGELKKAEKKLAAARGRKTQANARRDVRQARKKLDKAKAGSSKTFYARFATKVAGHARDAIRREVENAQFSHFKQAGYATFSWVAVNGIDACPSCEKRHGKSGSARQWKKWGKPGSGATYCGASCMCMLVPSNYKNNNRTLDNPLAA